MIQHTIEKLLASNLFRTVVVSTDDSEIARIAKDVGAEVPFLRNSDLSDDRTPTAPVIKDALMQIADAGQHFDYCCCVYPCVPMLEINDLVNGLRELRHVPDAKFCYSITKYEHPIQRSMRKSSSGFLEFLDAQHELTPTQKLETFYHDAGQFYWGTADAWISGAKMHSDSSLGLVMPTWRAIDIDDLDDWRRAEIQWGMLYRA